MIGISIEALLLRATSHGLRLMALSELPSPGGNTWKANFTSQSGQDLWPWAYGETPEATMALALHQALTNPPLFAKPRPSPAPKDKITLTLDDLL